MTKTTRNLFRIGAIACAALLAGCTGLELDRARGLSPQGSSFAQSLYGGYIKISTMEFGEHDYTDSDTFALRAASAAGGAENGPEEISMRKLPGDKIGVLTGARGRLVTALDAGGRTRAPAEAANAQVMFDCWMQEQEENFQPKDIAACRGGFLTSIAKVEGMLGPKPMAAKPAPMKQKFVVYFPFDSAKISGASLRIISDAVATAKKLGAKRVYVSGHADRSGNDNYNMALSDKRAAAVVGALTGGGLSGRMVSFGSFGENINAVATKDGVRADGNRRVEIEVSN